MIDDLFILAIFPLALLCVIGLRLTRPVVPVRVPVSVPVSVPRQIVSVSRPMALAESAPVVAYTDETIELSGAMLRFVEGL